MRLFLDISLATAQVLTTGGKFIVTAERDEKIRVSHFPNSYNIEAFCLGHTCHVSALAVHKLDHEQGEEDLLVSGGVDGSLRLWRLPDGQPLHTLKVGELIVTGADAAVNSESPAGHPAPGVEAIALTRGISGDGDICKIAVTFTR